MKSKLGILWRIALILPFASSLRGGENSSPAPTHFTASIGGFLGSSYSVKLHGDAITYTSVEAGNQHRTQIEIKPTAAQWQDLRQALDDLRVWRWRAEYLHDSVADGTQWALEIAYPDHDLRTRGNNRYPDANGKPANEPTQIFNRLLAAIRSLIGGRNFD